MKDGHFDIDGWLEQNAPEPSPPAPQDGSRAPASTPLPGGLKRVGRADGAGERYAREALEKEIQILESTSSGRNNRLNEASVRLFELVAAGVLEETAVQTSLEMAAGRIGLEPGEYLPTIASGRKKGSAQPRNLSHVGGGKSPGGKPPGGKPPRGGGGGGGSGGLPPRNDAGDGPNNGKEPELPCTPGHEENPHRLAKLFVQEKYNHIDCRTIQFWAKEFHVWEKGCYRHLDKLDLRAMLADVIHNDFERILNAQLAATMRGDDEKAKPPKPIPVTTNLVGHVIQALSGRVMLRQIEYPAQPAWIDREVGWPVDECVPMRNAIVHLPSLADGKPCTRKPTPRFFCPHVLSYDYQEDPPAPENWLRFLSQLWPNDEQSILTLQEWMGLQLVPDTRHQKIMGLIGPKRSGKGTIARIIQALVGIDSAASVRMSQMDGRFALEHAIGKLSLVIPDGRLSGKSDQAAIAELLLSISGEDALTIDRKHRQPWTGKMTCRITMLSNMLPRLADSSGALASRFIVLKFTKSFYGEEDLDLERKLHAELPGIFRWAADGWKRLRERGRLIQPGSGVEEFESMKALGSPISQFIDERLIVGEEESSSVKEVYNAWKAFCGENNIRETGDSATFSRNLRSVLANLRTRQRGSGAQRARTFEGISLIPPSDFGPAPEPASGALAGGQDGYAGGPILDDEGNPIPF